VLPVRYELNFYKQFALISVFRERNSLQFATDTKGRIRPVRGNGSAVIARNGWHRGSVLETKLSFRKRVRS
jgi:hypothetical protein